MWFSSASLVGGAVLDWEDRLLGPWRALKGGRPFLRGPF